MLCPTTFYNLLIFSFIIFHQKQILKKIKTDLTYLNLFFIYLFSLIKTLQQNQSAWMLKLENMQKCSWNNSIDLWFLHTQVFQHKIKPKQQIKIIFRCSQALYYTMAQCDSGAPTSHGIIVWDDLKTFPRWNRSFLIFCRWTKFELLNCAFHL